MPPLVLKGFALVVTVVAAAACAPSARSAAGSRSDLASVPPSGLYRAQPTTMSDTCGLADPQPSAGAAARSFFVTTSTDGSRVHANLPLSFDGPEWEELASRATIDFAQRMTLVDAPAPRCPGARRKRDIRVEASRATGVDIDVAETWSVPEGEDCEVAEGTPRRSCARVRRITLSVEKDCSSPRELTLLRCDAPLTR